MPASDLSQNASAHRIFSGRATRAVESPLALTRIIEKLCDDLGKRAAVASPGTLASLAGISNGLMADLVADRARLGVVLAARTSLPGQAILIQLAQPDVAKWIDRLLGAPPGREHKSRSLTAVDVRLCRLLLDAAHAALAWSVAAIEPGATIDIELVATEVMKVPAIRQLDKITIVDLSVGSPPDTFLTLRILLPETLAAHLTTSAARTAEAASNANNDLGWAEDVERQISRTRVDVTAVIAERLIDLERVASWHVGETVPLGVGRGALVSLESAGLPIAACELGRQGDRLVLRVSHPHDAEAAFKAELRDSIVSPGQAP